MKNEAMTNYLKFNQAITNDPFIFNKFNHNDNCLSVNTNRNKEQSKANKLEIQELIGSINKMRNIFNENVENLKKLSFMKEISNGFLMDFSKLKLNLEKKPIKEELILKSNPFIDNLIENNTFFTQIRREIEQIEKEFLMINK